jgi:hypothetical protein
LQTQLLGCILFPYLILLFLLLELRYPPLLSFLIKDLRDLRREEKKAFGVVAGTEK